jgi:hypothetical protein
MLCGGTVAPVAMEALGDLDVQEEIGEFVREEGGESIVCGGGGKSVLSAVVPRFAAGTHPVFGVAPTAFALWLFSQDPHNHLPFFFFTIFFSA